jgi:tetratricopeptide (TPR) repeat protein
MAAAAAAQVSAPPTVAPESVPAGFSSMGHEIPTAAPEIEHHEAASALSDMFSEFKEDAEESAGEAEDPDTHYNLGIAFKEMGLLDEAIGELQKVCHAIEHGHPFDQSMQAFTWLAQCLVDKGVPQAAVRWYEKALLVKNITEDGRLAVNYDLGCAYEMAGNQKKAYETFMEVYGSNIDYRDVADRIKTLKV